MSTRKVLNNFISNMLLLSPRNPKIHLPRYNDTGFLIYDKNNCYILPYYELAPYFKVHFYSTNSKNFNSNSSPGAAGGSKKKKNIKKYYKHNVEKKDKYEDFLNNKNDEFKVYYLHETDFGNKE